MGEYKGIIDSDDDGVWEIFSEIIDECLASYVYRHETSPHFDIESSCCDNEVVWRILLFY